MLNTKTLSQLESAQNEVISNFNLNLDAGIIGTKISLEDGLPWLEVYGKMTKGCAKEFVQDIADNMNIRVLYNRMESCPDNENYLCLVLDIDWKKAKELGSDQPIPAYSDNPNVAEFMKDYGKEVFPKEFKNTKTNKM